MIGNSLIIENGKKWNRTTGIFFHTMFNYATHSRTKREKVCRKTMAVINPAWEGKERLWGRGAGRWLQKIGPYGGDNGAEEPDDG